MNPRRWLAIAPLVLFACSAPEEGVDPASAWSNGGSDSATSSPGGGGFGGGFGGGSGVVHTPDAGADSTDFDALWASDGTDGAGLGQDVTPAADVGAPDTATAPPDSATPPEDTGASQPDSAAPEDTGNGTVLPTCGEDEVSVEKPKAPATVLIVMDRSGSMEGDKWEQAKKAVGSVLDAHGPYINFGLLVFPAKKSKGCVLPGTADVAFSLDNGATIVDAMVQAGTGGDTPTGGALQAASQIFQVANPPGERIVVVATDGKPNCAIDCGKCGCAFGCDFLCFNEDDCAEDEVFAAVQALAAQKVKTYVIGIEGSGSAKSVLNKMAELGGTALPGDPKYFEATNGDDLAAALDEIAGSVGSCSVPLQIPPGTAFVVVEVNGEKILKDPTHADGWDLLEGDVMQLYGSACEAATADGSTVEVTYVCKYKQ